MDYNFGLRELEAFVTVADCGSFTEAARRLLLTQPTISLRISSLEKSLAAKLLDRSRSRTRLTPAGEALLPHALATLRKRGEAMEAIRAATYWPAKFMEQEDNSGTIAAGKYADIIAVRGDVLRNISHLQNVDIVIKHGVRYK